MNSHLLFNFEVDKASNTVLVTREFAAPLSTVWDAWTIPVILDQWWAPKPYQTITKHMDFRVGGHWLYAMQGPDGIPHHCRADYTSIEPQVSYAGLDAFCDAQGNVDDSMPRSEWHIRFEAAGEQTIVHIQIRHKSLADLEKIIEMGFREGFTAALGNLDQYIDAQFKLRADNHPGTGSRVCTYLNFPGNTEDAFLFYQSVFQTEFVGKGIMRFGEAPASPGFPPVADSLKQMVLHVELPITANHILMGTDAPKEMGFTVRQGNNMHISLEPATRAEANRLFEGLSNGGNITMPLQDMFWGAYFGSFTDKFGINWMINCQAKQ